MDGFLLLGILVGMQHSLEADHLAAVGSMVLGERKTGRRALFMRGATWGLGHTITLFAICALALLFGLSLTESAGAALEFGVGTMLVLLGVDVLWRARKYKIHFHAHKHDGEPPHLHAHSHAQDPQPHFRSVHRHSHTQRLPLRALLIGLIHGAAGSAGLLVLAVAATQDAWTALGYVLLFGIGSILGMAALTLVAAWPLKVAARGAGWLHTGLTISVATLTIVIGIGVMVKTGPLASDLFAFQG